MKAFVVNLERSADRRTSITAQLASLGIDHELVRAVDARAMPEVAFAPMRSATRRMTRGMYACALSHQEACRRIASEGSRCGLVLEDDAALPPFLGELLSGIEEAIGEREVVLLSHYSHTRRPLHLSTCGARDCGGGVRLLRPLEIGDVASGLAYVVPGGVAERLAQSGPPTCAADHWGALHARDLIGSVRCAYPAVVGAAPFSTTIDYAAAVSLRGRMARLLRACDLPVVGRLLRHRFRRQQRERDQHVLAHEEPAWVTRPSDERSAQETEG